jgi:hypothetical protein
MRLLKYTTLTIILFSFFASTTFQSQVKYTTTRWKSPLFVIEMAGSFDLPIQDARGEIGDFFKFLNYGTKYGWGAKFNFKFGLGKKGDLRPYLTLGFTQLQASDDGTAYIGTNWIPAGQTGGYPLPGNQYFGSSSLPTVSGSSKIIFRIPHIGAGFEYAFVDVDKYKRRFIPFIGTDLDLSIITGIYRQTPNNTYGSIPAGQETAFTIKPDVRFGFGVGTGADVRFIPNFGMVFGVKYKFANLIGKNSSFLKEENKMNLLDGKNVSLNSNLYKDRNIAYMEFYIGGAIYLGKSKK